MRTRILITGLLAMILTGFGQVAMAADSGFFFSTKIGSTKVDGGGFNDSDISVHPSFGYDFNDVWGIVLGYDNFGKPDDTCGAGCFIKLKDATGFNLRVIGTLPLNDDWSLYGSAGWQHWKLKAKITDQGVVTFPPSEDGDEFVIGVGVKVMAIPKWNLRFRAGFDYFEADSVDISTFYVGAEKKFH